MTISIFIAPAGHGKTRYAMDLVREAARGLNASPRVCVANQQQLFSWQRRLAQPPGCIGAHVLTFDGLFGACLAAAGEPYTCIEEPVQHRLLRDAVGALPLEHFATLRAFPGFIQELERVIGEMKSAGITPQRFLDAVRQMGDAARLRELGQIYSHYQHHLKQNGLTDGRGMGWLALESLTKRAPDVGNDWTLLVLDGFASFTQTQLSLLRLLRERVESIVITLTGEIGAEAPRVVHRHLARTRQMLEEAFGVLAQPLPGAATPVVSGLARLEANLFRPEPQITNAAQSVTLAAAPDHADEVRVAMRWLKQRVVEDGTQLHEVALVARDITPYRPFILQIAEEFGLPVFIVDGPPLQSNPCIAALMTLLRLILPVGGDGNVYRPALPRRALMATLRSPYFDWQFGQPDGAPSPTAGLSPDDVETLDAVGRWGRVIAGADQWWEILERLAGAYRGESLRADDDDESGDLPSLLPRGKVALDLQERLRSILRYLTPPQGMTSYTDFVRWLEDLIGPDIDERADPQSSASLNMIACVRKAEASIRERDVAALQTLKDLLRGLIWTEKPGIDGKRLDYTQFFQEVAGAVEATGYRPGLSNERNAILVSNVIQARGVPFRALAVMGLGEGFFPGMLSEDPFLRESDRLTLRTEYHLPLDSTIDSHEQEYFYVTVTRPWERLLLTRPRQTDEGATWQPSPFWTEVERLSPADGRNDERRWLEFRPAASAAELLHALARARNDHAAAILIQAGLATRWQQIEDAAGIFNARWSQGPSQFKGLLSDAAATMAERFGQEYGWSPSRLESYLGCPYQFFLSSVLGLETRAEPVEGLDARQLGNIYHDILEQTYRRLPHAERSDPDCLRASLETVATELLANAPRREGFRETAWWRETRREIHKKLQQSLEELIVISEGFVPIEFEKFFGGSHPFYVDHNGERFRLRGVIDRVDVDEQGHIRLIDYKTAGPDGYSRSAHQQGKRLQLPLYALAAQDALQLGPVVDGFYWHVQQSKPSAFSLQAGGSEEAMQTAADHALDAIHGVRAGHFGPKPPEDGCPTYCPGAAFCWHYTPRGTW